MYFDILDIYDINEYGIFRIILVGCFGDLVVQRLFVYGEGQLSENINQN